MRYVLEFTHPWLLAGALLAVPAVWLAVRNLGALSRARRRAATAVRVLVLLLLVLLLAEPHLARINESVTVVAIIDRSRSVPEPLRKQALDFLEKALRKRGKDDRLAVINVAELAVIEKLASSNTTIRRRETSLRGEESDLAGGIKLAMAIAPAESATRFVFVSDGNETRGDLKEAARLAAADGIPIDVLPLRYEYPREVIFKRLAAPNTARRGETVRLRFVLSSTTPTEGKIFLSLNGKPVDLDPSGPGLAAAVELRRGTNVKIVSLPVGSRGIYEFEASFVPDDPTADAVEGNNRASAMTLVSGPGEILVLDGGGGEGAAVVRALRESGHSVRYLGFTSFPERLAELVNTDAVVLVNAPGDAFSGSQQELLKLYVKELGGGLVFIGGPDSFGAGGWTGSPVAEILPVDLDPPQKRELPRGALVLMMHSCEMARGNYWGEVIAISAVKTLSPRDYVGLMSYRWEAGNL